MQKLFVPEPGEHIEDMDMFKAALILCMRSKGRPCIRIIPLPTGELCSTPAECSLLLQLGNPSELTQTGCRLCMPSPISAPRSFP